MSKKLSGNGFKDKFTSEFNVDFIKKYNEKSNEGYILDIDVQYAEYLLEPHNDLSFLLEIKKLINSKNL